jgi:uncharacterized protein YraI
MLKRVMAALAIGAALSTLAVAPAQAGGTKLSSTIKYCRYFPHNGYGGAVSYSDYYAYCAQVYTTISSLTVRTGPSTAYASDGTLLGGIVTEFDCWVYGQTVDTNNVWLKLYTPAGSRYVSDRYVYTGPNLKTILSHC